MLANRPQRDRGLTLVEMLAVIVIVSLVAGVAAVGLAASSETAQLQAIGAEWRDLDGRARLFARSLGPVVMTMHGEGTVVRLDVRETGELLSEIALPAVVSGRIDTDMSDDSIVFDRLGRSVDYEVTLQGAERVIRWRVCGLTGLIVKGNQ